MFRLRYPNDSLIPYQFFFVCSFPKFLRNVLGKKNMAWNKGILKEPYFATQICSTIEIISGGPVVAL